MNLTRTEMERLTIFTATELARRRRGKGLRLTTWRPSPTSPTRCWRGVYARASTLSAGGGAMARLLAHDAVALGEGFRAGWRALRCALTGQSGWL
jgi:hypothetical protein